MTKEQKEIRAIITAHGEELIALRLYEKETKQLYDAFKTIDVENCGWIRISQLFRYLRLEENNFSRTVFSVYDDKNTGYICFRDFAVIVWNMCTLPPSPLIEFVFTLYDADRSKDIDVDEAKEMIRDLFGDDFNKQGESARIYRDLEVLTRSTVDLDIFCHFYKLNPTLLQAPKELQEILRARVLHLDYWIRAGKKRVEAFGPKLYISPDQIFMKVGAKRTIPHMPRHVRKMKSNTKRRVGDSSEIEGGPQMPIPEKGSKEWRDMKLSVNNPEQKGRGLEGISVDKEKTKKIKHQKSKDLVLPPQFIPDPTAPPTGEKVATLLKVKEASAKKIKPVDV